MRTETPGIILASQSPRRREFLTQWGIQYDCYPSDCDEPGRGADESLHDYVQRVAEVKACAVALQFPSRLVLGADTIVAIGDEIFGKPRDSDEAILFLKQLSNGWHEVLTGVSMICLDEDWEYAGSVVTRVLFKEMSQAEIDSYVATGEPLDKAGAYAIQGGAEAFVVSIDGPLDNVIGLPREAVLRGLKKFHERTV